jgi:hypothetical protein
VTAFVYRLEKADGGPVEPPTIRSAISNWGPGDTIPLGPRTLRVVGVRDDGEDKPPVLVVEDAA